MEAEKTMQNLQKPVEWEEVAARAVMTLKTDPRF